MVLWKQINVFIRITVVIKEDTSYAYEFRYGMLNFTIMFKNYNLIECAYLNIKEKMVSSVDKLENYY